MMEYKERYEALLEKAREMMNNECSSEQTKAICQEFFPELAESEDERIRKEITEFLRVMNGYCNPNQDWDLNHRWLPWLEKQKESKKALRLVGKGFLSDPDAYYELVSVEQKEQRSKDVENVDNLHQYLYGEQKPVEWSAYDKATIEYIIEDIKELRDEETDEEVIDTYDRELNLLQCINDSVKLCNYTNPAEWSEDYREEDIQTRFAFYTYKDEDGVLYLSNVFVEEASRNHGFGTKILIAAEKVAETIGATTISLKVKQDSLANAWYRKNGYGYVAFEDGYDWLEKNLEYMKPNKPEWSEEDEENFKWFDKFFRAESVVVGGREIPQDKYQWFKSLRPQSKQEWSEEDEKMISEIIHTVTGYHPVHSTSELDSMVDWLKSLPPSWKPSKVQMDALAWYSGNSGVPPTGDKAIKSLYNDLKKL